jgi:hypothetical protein
MARGGVIFKTEGGKQLNEGSPSVCGFGAGIRCGQNELPVYVLIHDFAFAFGVVLNGQLFELPPNEMRRYHRIGTSGKSPATGFCSTRSACFDLCPCLTLALHCIAPAVQRLQRNSYRTLGWRRQGHGLTFSPSCTVFSHENRTAWNGTIVLSIFEFSHFLSCSVS